MNKLKKNIMAGSIALCIIIIGILTPKVTNAIKIDYTDPKNTIVVNKTISETIPLSIYGKNFQEGDTIYINDYPQNTAYGNEKWMTCYISIPNLEQVKEFEIQIKRLDKEGKITNKSNQKIISITRQK